MPPKALLLFAALSAAPIASAQADDVSAAAKALTGVDVDEGRQQAVFIKRAAFADGLYRGRLMMCGDKTKSVVFHILIRHTRDSEKLDILRLANAGVDHARSQPSKRKADPSFCADASRQKQANDGDVFKTLK